MHDRSRRAGQPAGELGERLRRILSLEKQREYADTAVIGGLSALVERFQATPGLAPSALGALAHLREYSGATPPVRRDMIDRALALLDGLVVESSPRYSKADSSSRVGDGRQSKPASAARANGKPPSGDRVVTPTASEPTGAPRSTASQRSPRREAPRAPRTAVASGLDAPLNTIKGIGGIRSQKLRKLGLETIGDLLFFTPRRHLDFRNARRIADLEEGVPQTIVASVWNVQTTPTRSRLVRITATLNDLSGSCRALWFRAHDYISNELPADDLVIVSGIPEIQQGVMTFRDPEWEVYGSGNPLHTARLVPVYSLTEGLNDRWLRRMMKQIVDAFAAQVVDPLPARVRGQHELLDLPMALAQAHFPDSPELLERAQRRLAFDELLLIQLGAEGRRREWKRGGVAPTMVEREVLERFVSSLPFGLTGAQHRVLNEIADDLGRSEPMHRLLQGDVGSGKTVVATGAMLLALANGHQSVLMAPTEILAEQHFRTISRLVETAGQWIWPGRRRQVTVGLLTGSLSRGAKEELVAAIADGAVDLVIGTHALIEDTVLFHRLGLVVVDEQHRFGVLQRAALRAKGEAPHVLVMTATPIPRTLALTLYGDLDVSIIDEMPAGRQEIVTRCLKPSERGRAYGFIRKQVAEGRQAFVICPLVEASEKLELKAATDEYERLQLEVFRDLKLGLLHGRMKGAEKDEVMRAFQRGELHILVSTAVVEVGVDVPNATVMLIEGADRFGLAQLHQFRGRVGRGTHQSYCILVSESRSQEALERLATVERTRDGFQLAEADLTLRGPGEFFGTRQSGIPELRYARLTDIALIEEARSAARAVLAEDPDLAWPEHTLLATRLRNFWSDPG